MAINTSGITMLYTELLSAVKNEYTSMWTANEIDAKTYAALVGQAGKDMMNLSAELIQKQEQIEKEAEVKDAQIVSMDKENAIKDAQESEVLRSTRLKSIEIGKAIAEMPEIMRNKLETVMNELEIQDSNPITTNSSAS